MPVRRGRTRASGWDDTQTSFALLASSSAGNACLVTTHGPDGRYDLLIDAGLPARQLEQALSDAGTSITRLGAVLFTHGHSDHIRSARFVARRSKADLYASLGALRTVQGLAGRTVHPVNRPRYATPPDAAWPAVACGPFSVRAFPVPHDFPDTVGYRLQIDGRSLAYATDVGCPTPQLEQALTGADAVVLEANHDPTMLAAGPYPPPLKARIGGGLGHLANRYAAALLSAAIAQAPRAPSRIVLAHLSETNNTPERAIESVRKGLPRRVPVEAAPARGPSPIHPW